MPTQLLNYIGGEWRRSGAREALNVFNPATAEVIATMPLSPAAEVDAAVQTARVALKDWRQTPAGERAQVADVSTLTTRPCGRTGRND